MSDAEAVIAFLDGIIEILSTTGDTFPFFEALIEDRKVIEIFKAFFLLTYPKTGPHVLELGCADVMPVRTDGAQPMVHFMRRSGLRRGLPG